MTAPLPIETIEELERSTEAQAFGEGDTIYASRATMRHLLAAARRVAELPDVGEPEDDGSSLVYRMKSSVHLYVIARKRDGACLISGDPRTADEVRWLAAALLAAARSYEAEGDGR